MASSKKPKKGKSRSKEQEDRVILKIERGLIDQLEGLADSEELSLRDYIRQFLKHQVVANNTQEREFGQFRESQKGAPRPKIRGLPTKTGRVVASPHVLAQPDPFQYPDTDIARALVKRAMRHQALPEAWGYECLAINDREGMPHHILNKPSFVFIAREDSARTKPFWKVAPGAIGDQFMSHIRRALQGDHSQNCLSVERQGRQLNFTVKYLDLGKGLVACLVKHSWGNDSHSVTPPTDVEELSRYYLLKKRLDVSDPQCVWWVQDTGCITNHRSQIELMPLFSSSQGRPRHIEEMCDEDSATCIMSHIHEVLQTREKQSFTLEEYLENLRTLNSYTVYPLNDIRPKERDGVMVTMSCIASTILDSQKIYSFG